MARTTALSSPLPSSSSKPPSLCLDSLLKNLLALLSESTSLFRLAWRSTRYLRPLKRGWGLRLRKLKPLLRLPARVLWKKLTKGCEMSSSNQVKRNKRGEYLPTYFLPSKSLASIHSHVPRLISFPVDLRRIDLFHLSCLYLF